LLFFCACLCRRWVATLPCLALASFILFYFICLLTLLYWLLMLWPQVPYQSATLAIPPVFLYHLKHFFYFSNGIFAFKGMSKTMVNKLFKVWVNPANKSELCWFLCFVRPVQRGSHIGHFRQKLTHICTK
jgi:hypothetical protein